MARKPIDETVTDVVGSTQNIAEVLATITDLTRAARAAADLSIQLYAIAERIKDLLDRLAPGAKQETSRPRSSNSEPPDAARTAANLSVQLYAAAERVENLLDRLAPAAKGKTPK